MIILFLLFWGTLILFFTVVAPTYIFTNSVGEFPFLHILSSIYCFVDFLMMTILTGVRWHFIGVLICISLIISNVEHLFTCIAIGYPYISRLEKCLFRSVHCSVRLLFLLLSLWAVCIFWKLTPFSCIICKYFYHCVGWLFILCVVSFAKAVS